MAMNWSPQNSSGTSAKVTAKRWPVDNVREAWLQQAVKKLEPVLKDAGLLPPKVLVSVGFPSRKALSTKSRAIGECWHAKGINQDVSQIFISPVLGNRNKVLSVLLHELVHAALPPDTKHNKTFASYVGRIGLEGHPTTANTPNKELNERLNAIFKSEKYPHPAFDFSKLAKKQTTRLRLYQCECDPPVKVRVARDDFDATCNICESPFELQEV
jgi:hypothetical protein